MSKEPEKIQPLAVDLGQDAAAPSTAAAPPQATTGLAGAKTNKLLWPALLLVLAGFVVFALPQMVPENAQRPASVAQSGAASAGNSAAAPNSGTTAAKSSKAEASPWQDAQLARQRKSAQDSLQQLLDLQFELEEQGIADWGADALARARELAAQGDEAYKARDYATAKSGYTDAYTLLQQVQADIPQRLQALLQQGQDALFAGDKAAAEAAFARALLIEPTNSAAQDGQKKAAVLDEVLALKRTADKALAAAQWSDAEAQYQQAIAQFAAFPGLKEGLENARQGRRQSAYDSSMGQAFSQLGVGNYVAAERAFRRALKEKPGDAQARAGIEQALAEQDTRSIQQQLSKAKNQIIDEDWESADASYRRILTIDASLKGAQQQHALVQRRLKLDQALQSSINDPLRLSSDAVYRAASDLLLKARAEKPRGPKLAEQIASLDALLRASQQLQPVALNSDGQTDVILLKVARLGRFNAKSLDLKPGKYTLLGSRDGYQDVRVSFTLQAGQSLPALNIRCTKKI